MRFFRRRLWQVSLLGIAIGAAALALGSGDTAPAVAQTPGAATETKFFVPLSLTGMINPSVTVRSRMPFMGNPNLSSDCQSGSISTQRPDAWRCGTADPCFAQLFGTAMTVACSSAPWDNEVVILELSRPLPTPEQCRSMPNDCPRPLDLNTPPWAVELANGARCTKFTGTISEAAGLGLIYGCDNGGSIGVADRDNPFDKSQPVWRAFYLPRDGAVISQVGVLTVWY